MNENFFDSIIERISSTDWAGEGRALLDRIGSVANGLGRVLGKQLLRCYYVLTEGNLSTREKAWVYAAIIYVLVPGDLVPRRIFHLLGIVDDAAAIWYVIGKIEKHITPEIDQRVDMQLDKWFGYEIKTNKD